MAVAQRRPWWSNRRVVRVHTVDSPIGPIGKRQRATKFLGRWTQTGEPAENAANVRSAKTFDPVAALYHHSGSAGLDEIMVAGHEGLAGYRRPVVQVFQPQSGTFTRVRATSM